MIDDYAEIGKILPKISTIEQKWNDLTDENLKQFDNMGGKASQEEKLTEESKEISDKMGGNDSEQKDKISENIAESKKSEGNDETSDNVDGKVSHMETNAEDEEISEKMGGIVSEAESEEMSQKMGGIVSEAESDEMSPKMGGIVSEAESEEMGQKMGGIVSEEEQKEETNKIPGEDFSTECNKDNNGNMQKDPASKTVKNSGSSTADTSTDLEDGNTAHTNDDIKDGISCTVDTNASCTVDTSASCTVDTSADIKHNTTETNMGNVQREMSENELSRQDKKCEDDSQVVVEECLLTHAEHVESAVKTNTEGVACLPNEDDHLHCSQLGDAEVQYNDMFDIQEDTNMCESLSDSAYMSACVACLSDSLYSDKGGDITESEVSLADDNKTPSQEDISKTNSKEDISITISDEDISKTNSREDVSISNSKEDISKAHSQEDITKTNSREDISKTISQEDISKAHSQEDISKTNSKEDINKTNSKEDISKAHSQEVISKTNSKEDISKTISDEDISKTNSREDISKAISDEDISKTIIQEDISKTISDEDIGKTISDEDISKTISDEDISKKISDEDISKTSRKDIDKTSSDESICKKNSQEDISKTNSNEYISKTTSKEDISKPNSQEDISKTTSHEDISKTTSDESISKNVGEENVSIIDHEAVIEQYSEEKRTCTKHMEHDSQNEEEEDDDIILPRDSECDTKEQLQRILEIESDNSSMPDECDGNNNVDTVELSGLVVSAHEEKDNLMVLSGLSLDECEQDSLENGSDIASLENIDDAIILESPVDQNNDIISVDEGASLHNATCEMVLTVNDNVSHNAIHGHFPSESMSQNAIDGHFPIESGSQTISISQPDDTWAENITDSEHLSKTVCTGEYVETCQVHETDKVTETVHEIKGSAPSPDCLGLMRNVLDVTERSDQIINNDNTATDTNVSKDRSIDESQEYMQTATNVTHRDTLECINYNKIDDPKTYSPHEPQSSQMEKMFDNGNTLHSDSSKYLLQNVCGHEEESVAKVDTVEVNDVNSSDNNDNEMGDISVDLSKSVAHVIAPSEGNEVSQYYANKAHVNDSVETPQSYDDHGETPQLYDDHGETPQSYDDHGETPQSYDDHVETPQSYDDHLETTQSYDDHVENPQLYDDHGETPQSYDDHIETPQSYDDHVETSQSYDDHVETSQSYDDHGETPQSYDDLVETPQLYDDHVETPQSYDDHVETPQSYDDHVETPQLHNDHKEIPGLHNHVKTPQLHDDHVEPPQSQHNIRTAQNEDLIETPESKHEGHNEENPQSQPVGHDVDTLPIGSTASCTDEQVKQWRTLLLDQSEMATSATEGKDSIPSALPGTAATDDGMLFGRPEAEEVVMLAWYQALSHLDNQKGDRSDGQEYSEFLDENSEVTHLESHIVDKENDVPLLGAGESMAEDENVVFYPQWMKSQSPDVESRSVNSHGKKADTVDDMNGNVFSVAVGQVTDTNKQDGTETSDLSELMVFSLEGINTSDQDQAQTSQQEVTETSDENGNEASGQEVVGTSDQDHQASTSHQKVIEISDQDQASASHHEVIESSDKNGNEAAGQKVVGTSDQDQASTSHQEVIETSDENGNEASGQEVVGTSDQDIIGISQKDVIEMSDQNGNDASSLEIARMSDQDMTKTSTLDLTSDLIQAETSGPQEVPGVRDIVEPIIVGSSDQDELDMDDIDLADDSLEVDDTDNDVELVRKLDEVGNSESRPEREEPYSGDISIDKHCQKQIRVHEISQERVEVNIDDSGFQYSPILTTPEHDITTDSFGMSGGSYSKDFSTPLVQECCKSPEAQFLHVKVEWPDKLGCISFDREDNVNPELASSKMDEGEYTKCLGAGTDMNEFLEDIYLKTDSPYATKSVKTMHAAVDIEDVAPSAVSERTTPETDTVMVTTVAPLSANHCTVTLADMDIQDDSLEDSLEEADLLAKLNREMAAPYFIPHKVESSYSLEEDGNLSSDSLENLSGIGDVSCGYISGCDKSSMSQDSLDDQSHSIFSAEQTGGIFSLTTPAIVVDDACDVSSNYTDDSIEMAEPPGDTSHLSDNPSGTSQLDRTLFETDITPTGDNPFPTFEEYLSSSFSSEVPLLSSSPCMQFPHAMVGCIQEEEEDEDEELSSCDSLCDSPKSKPKKRKSPPKNSVSNSDTFRPAWMTSNTESYGFYEEEATAL